MNLVDKIKELKGQQSVVSGGTIKSPLVQSNYVPINITDVKVGDFIEYENKNTSAKHRGLVANIISGEVTQFVMRIGPKSWFINVDNIRNVAKNVKSAKKIEPQHINDLIQTVENIEVKAPKKDTQEFYETGEKLTKQEYESLKNSIDVCRQDVIRLRNSLNDVINWINKQS